MNLTAEELASLNAATSEKSWNMTCDAIKRARNGEYPPDWYMSVMASGVMARAQLRFIGG